MDERFYSVFRQATQEELYQAVRDPENELYDIVWDLFETVVIEPAELFDPDFREENQFRYHISGRATLEFFPCEGYFEKRIEPNPFRDEADPAGIHLKFSLLPDMSCLFSTGFQVWGAPERQALKKLWFKHRSSLCDLFRKNRPMISTLIPFPAVEYASSLEEMLDNYFQVRDPENFLSFNYAFARTDEADVAQNFMVTMAMLYYAVRDYCLDKEDRLRHWHQKLRDFYSGHLPELPAPLPCVPLTISKDAD